jgi:hypothetical protein
VLAVVEVLEAVGDLLAVLAEQFLLQAVQAAVQVGAVVEQLVL